MLLSAAVFEPIPESRESGAGRKKFVRLIISGHSPGGQERGTEGAGEGR
jgi:hypothetical protein